MKTRLIVLMLILFRVPTLAQDGAQAPDLDQDLGFNAVFIFQGLFQSTQAPFSVMYKKYKSEHKALRLGADVSFSGNDHSGIANGGYSNNSSANIYLIVGVEKQRLIGGKWTWYNGFDAVPSFSFSQYETYSNNVKSNSYRNSTVGLGARPFVGIRFAITPRLYVSAEASAQLTYSIDKVVNKNHQPEQTVRDLQNTIVSFHINPASGIFVFYRF